VFLALPQASLIYAHERSRLKQLLCVFAEHGLANLLGGFAAVFDVEGAGGFEAVDVQIIAFFQSPVSAVPFGTWFLSNHGLSP
jgi:hypothetical protein